MTFKEKYLAGEIEFEAIDDYVDEWNNSDDERTLAKFGLSLNADEEDAWIDDGDEALKEMLDAGKHNSGISFARSSEMVIFHARMLIRSQICEIGYRANGNVSCLRAILKKKRSAKKHVRLHDNSYTWKDRDHGEQEWIRRASDPENHEGRGRKAFEKGI